MAASQAAAAAAHLTGIFVELNRVLSYWTDVELRGDFQAMVDIGIEFVVVRAVALGTSFDEGDVDACPLGRFNLFYPASSESVISCVDDDDDDDDSTTLLLDRVMDAASDVGLKVHLGLAYPSGASKSFGLGENSTRYFQEYAWLQWSLAEDLWARYGSGGGDYSYAIEGFYTDLETCNTVGWLDYATELVGHFLQPLAADIHGRLSEELLVWSSPYYVANLTRFDPTNIMDADFFADFREQIFLWAPDLDHIAPQDSMGAQGNSFDNVTDFMTAMRDRVAESRDTLWSNVELFETWPPECQWPDSCGRHPAPFDRIRAQMENEWELVDALIAWEWWTCLSPNSFANASAAARLYADYKSYWDEINILPS